MLKQKLQAVDMLHSCPSATKYGRTGPPGALEFVPGEHSVHTLDELSPELTVPAAQGVQTRLLAAAATSPASHSLQPVLCTEGSAEG